MLTLFAFSNRIFFSNFYLVQCCIMSWMKFLDLFWFYPNYHLTTFYSEKCNFSHSKTHCNIKFFLTLDKFNYAFWRPVATLFIISFLLTLALVRMHFTFLDIFTWALHFSIAIAHTILWKLWEINIFCSLCCHFQFHKWRLFSYSNFYVEFVLMDKNFCAIYWNGIPFFFVHHLFKQFYSHRKTKTISDLVSIIFELKNYLFTVCVWEQVKIALLKNVEAMHIFSICLCYVSLEKFNTKITSLKFFERIIKPIQIQMLIVYA